MTYADLSEEHKERSRLYQRKWRLNNPQLAKKMQQRSIERSFQPTVYAYFDSKGIPTYVGKSNFPKRRVADHRKYSPWWEPNLLLVSMSCRDEWEAMEYEGKWGGIYRPIYNIDGQRKEKYGYKEVE